VALAALLIAVGLAACGGGDSSSSTPAGTEQGTAEGTSSQNRSEKGGGESSPGSGGEGQSGNSSAYTPKHHHDSGGGSTQFKVKGGDNSVQEFGEEADSAERDAAAVALHGFLDARAEGNWAAACEFVARSVVVGLEKLSAHAKGGDLSCAGILEKLTNPIALTAMKAEAKKANVGSLRTEGGNAFIIYTGTGGTFLAMPMANEGGDWKVSSLAGTPLN